MANLGTADVLVSKLAEHHGTETSGMLRYKQGFAYFWEADWGVLLRTACYQAIET